MPSAPQGKLYFLRLQDKPPILGMAMAPPQRLLSLQCRRSLLPLVFLAAVPPSPGWVRCPMGTPPQHHGAGRMPACL